METMEEIILDEDAILAERRRRRIEIAAKYAAANTSVQAETEPPESSSNSENQVESLDFVAEAKAIRESPQRDGDERSVKRLRLLDSERIKDEEDGGAFLLLLISFSHLLH